MQLFLIDHDQAIPCRRLPGGALAEVDHGRYAKRMDEPVRRLAVVGVLPPCRPREAGRQDTGIQYGHGKNIVLNAGCGAGCVAVPVNLGPARAHFISPRRYSQAPRT